MLALDVAVSGKKETSIAAEADSDAQFAGVEQSHLPETSIAAETDAAVDCVPAENLAELGAPIVAEAAVPEVTVSSADENPGYVIPMSVQPSVPYSDACPTEQEAATPLAAAPLAAAVSITEVAAVTVNVEAFQSPFATTTTETEVTGLARDAVTPIAELPASLAVEDF